MIFFVKLNKLASFETGKAVKEFVKLSEAALGTITFAKILI